MVLPPASQPVYQATPAQPVYQAAPAQPVYQAAPAQPIYQAAPVQTIATYQPYYSQPQSYAASYYNPFSYGVPGFHSDYVADGIYYSRVFDGFSYLDPAQAFRQRWPYLGY